MELTFSRFLIIILALIQFAAAPNPGEACTGEGQCQGNSQCTSPDVDGTCDCKEDFRRFGKNCVSNTQYCRPSFNRTAIKRGSKNFEMHCRNLQSSDTATWFSSTEGVIPAAVVGSCPPLPGNCTQNLAAQFRVSRATEGTSVLTILDPTALLSAGRSVVISCRASNDQVKLSSRLLDLYDRATEAVTGPELTEEGIQWVRSGQITMTGVYSLSNCFGCMWLQENQETKEQLTLPEDVTSFEKRAAANGTFDITCGLRNHRLPEKEGHYKYKVYFHHRGLPFVDTGKPFQIRHPQPPLHDCPAIVAEGDTLQCKCIPLDKGLPQRVFTWNEHSSTEQLTVQKVGRQQHGTKFTCSEQSGVKVTYTLRVAYGPNSVEIAPTADSDTSVRLLCIALGVYPTPSFTWRDPDTNTVVSKGQELEVKAGDLTKYTQIECEAMNLENKGKVATARITMEELETEFNITVQRQGLTSSDDNKLWVGVVIGVFVMLPFVLVLAGILACMFIRKKGSKTLAGASEPDGRTSFQFVDILDRQRSETGETTERKATHEADDQGTSTQEERGYPEGASNYDALDQQAMAQQSPYDSLRTEADSQGKPRLDNHPKPPFYHQDSGPLYENRSAVLDSPIYANSPPCNK